jgi:hypothetical protein
MTDRKPREQGEGTTTDCPLVVQMMNVFYSLATIIRILVVIKCFVKDLIEMECHSPLTNNAQHLMFPSLGRSRVTASLPHGTVRARLDK